MSKHIDKRTGVVAVALGIASMMLVSGCGILPGSQPKQDEQESENVEQTQTENAENTANTQLASNTYSQGNKDNTSNSGDSSFTPTSNAIVIEQQQSSITNTQATTLLPYVALSENLADGEMALDGHKIKLGETSLMEILPELDYFEFYDPSGNGGNTKRVSAKDAPQYIAEQRLIGHYPLTVSVIWREKDQQASYKWTNFTIWNLADEHLPLGECKIVAVEHGNQFDAKNNESVYAELPKKIDTETKGKNMSTFVDTYGPVAEIPGYIGFSDAGKSWWTWNADGRALLGIRVGTGDTNSRMTAQGFKYSLPIRQDGGSYVIDGR